MSISAFEYNLTIAPLIDEICQPLSKHLGITHFGYIKILKDGLILRIANRPDWTQKYFENNFYNDLDIYSMETVPIGGTRTYILSGAPANEHCKALCFEFNIWNCFIIYERFEDYGHFWFFSSTKDNQEILDLYLNNNHLLQHFTNYFRERFPDLLDSLDRKKLIQTEIEPLKQLYKKDEKIDQFFSKTLLSNLTLRRIKFSKRQTECLIHLLKGKTMKEIARILSLSPRTIETYINIMKMKTGYTTKSQLIKNALSERIFLP